MTSQSTSDRQPAHNTFVGRERELAELRAGLDDVSAGHGRLFLLSGEPGIGKTRLAEEICNDASARGMRVVWGRSWEGGGAPAYWPFIQILRACVADRDSEDLKPLLGSGASEIARLLPDIKLSLASIEERKATTDSESARFWLFDAVATLLKNVARSEPLLIVIDDLHDADQPSLQMLRFIARQSKAARILMVGTYRDAEVRQSPELGKLIGELNRESHSIPIVGLNRGEIARFVESRSGRTADQQLVSDLYDATDGNALFVDGVVRLLVAEGNFARAGAVGTGRFKIPEGIRDSIRKQLAALSGETKFMLSVASVIGYGFDSRLLEKVTESSAEQIAERAEGAERLGIVTRDSASHARFRFSHALIREVLYYEMATKRRIELHGDIGAAIEELYQEDLTPHLAPLAHHYGQAGIGDRAIDYSIRAGEAAIAVLAYEDAALHWQTALALMKEQKDVPVRQARLLVALGNLQSAINLSDSKGIEFLEHALKIYEGLGRRDSVARVHSHLGAMLCSYPSAITDIPKAVEHYRKAEAVLSQGPDRRSLAAVCAGLAQVAFHLNRTADGLAWSQRAMEISERVGDQDIWLGAATLQGFHLFSRGKLADALSTLDLAYEKADRSSFSYSPAWVAGAFRSYLLDPCEARTWYLRELAKPRVAQVPSRRRILLDALASSYLTEGNLAEARKAVAELGGDRDERTRDYEDHGGGAALAFREGQWERAESATTRSLDVVRRSGSLYEVESRLQALAVARFIRGDLAKAEALLQEALELSCVEKECELHLQLKHRTLLALIYANTSRVGEAHQQLERCREIIDNGEDWRGLVGLVAKAEAVVAATEGKYEDAEKQFAKAVEIFRRYHVPFEEAEALYHWGQALNVPGEHGRANEKLDAAVEIYQNHGAGQRWIDRVQAEKARATKPTATPPAIEKPRAEFDCLLRREGEYWTLERSANVFRLRHSKGLSYLAQLLASPGREFHALEMAQAVDTEPNEDDEGAVPDEDDDAAATEHSSRSRLEVRGDLGDAGAMLDDAARAAYGRRLTELRDEIDEAREFKDNERAVRAQEEIDALGRELKGAIGLAGRDRRAASSTERARIAVTKAIRLSLNKIAENDASLGKLLSTTIKTGTVCAYIPDDRFPVSWRL